MKDIWKKYKTYLIISIYLISVGLVGFFIVRPMVLAIKKNSDQIQQKIAIQEGKEVKLRELSSIRSQFEEVKKQEEKINISLTEENVVSLIETLEKISEETGNKIKMELSKKEQDNKKDGASSIKSKEGVNILLEELPNDKYVKIKINLYGSYSSFLSFLNKIENMEFYSDVISLVIKRAAESGLGLSANPFIGENNPGNESGDLGDKISSQLDVVFYLENK